MKYALHPGAEIDLREAANFYRIRAGDSLARALLDEFDQAMAHLLEHPKLGGKWRHNTRRHMMRRFPYWIVYRETRDELLIVAVAHQSRRPNYWGNRR